MTFKKKLALQKIFWVLPYKLRRIIFRLLKPSLNVLLREMKYDVDAEGYSFKGFSELNCLFVHIPKSAGISINNTLFGTKGGGHRTILDFQLIYSQREINKFYKFTFVRNPYDRLFSAYNFLKEGGFNSKDSQWSKKNLSEINSFEEFVMKWLNTENIYSYIHFIPQFEFVCDKKLNLLVDKIYHLENIQSDFEHLKKKLNIKSNLNILNKTNHQGNIHKEMTNEMKLKIKKLYKNDFDLFEYN